MDCDRLLVYDEILQKKAKVGQIGYFFLINFFTRNTNWLTNSHVFKTNDLPFLIVFKLPMGLQK